MHKSISKLIENLDLTNPEMKETRKGFGHSVAFTFLRKVVSKFGGTSMGDAVCMLRSAEICLQQTSSVVVVSATSGTTNRLIELAQKAQSGKWEEAESLLILLREKHFIFRIRIKHPAGIPIFFLNGLF